MLKKKMIRGIMEHKVSYGACMLVIAIGISMYVSFTLVLLNLQDSKETFYREQNFADAFVVLEGMPQSKVEELSDIEGIEDIQGRIVKDVRVLSLGESTYVRFISKDRKYQRMISDFEIIDGTPLEENLDGIIVDNKFFDANNLEMGDSIEVAVEGKKKELVIQAIGRNPEYIYAMRKSSQIFPEPAKFGIGFIDREEMENLFDLKGLSNEIVFTIEEGYDFEKIKAKLEPRLKKYGLKSLYERKYQRSHVLITEEINGLKSMTGTVPVLFLIVASMVLYIMLRRMVEHERGQIGILKSLGYTKNEIMVHYISYALIVGVLGGILGGIAGTYLSYLFTDIYIEYFNMPKLQGSISVKYMAISIMIASSFSIFAGYQGCKVVLNLSPATALRPKAPYIGKKLAVEKARAIWKMFTVQGKMSVRNIFRNKGRSFFISFGVMFTTSLLVLSLSMRDLSVEMLLGRFKDVETYDVKISIDKYVDSKTAKEEVLNSDGIVTVETMAEIPVTLKYKWRKKDLMLLGIEENSTLYHILDEYKNEIAIPNTGIIISERASKLLQASEGDVIRVDSIYLDDEAEVAVRKVVPQSLGLNGYMSMKQINGIFESRNVSNAVIIKMDEENIADLKEKYKEVSFISGVEDTGEMLESLTKLLETNMFMMVMLSMFGFVTNFAVIYNSAIITLSERNREMASMRVLGMTQREVLQIISFEQWSLGCIGIIMGMPMAKMMMVGMANSIDNDIYTMPTNVSVKAMITGVLFSIFSIWVGQRMASFKIKKLDMVEVLKERE